MTFDARRADADCARIRVDPTRMFPAIKMSTTDAHTAVLPRFFTAHRYVLGLLFCSYVGGWLIDHLRTRGIAAAPHFVQAACAMFLHSRRCDFLHFDPYRRFEAAYVVFNLLVFAATPSGLTAWQLLTSAAVTRVDRRATGRDRDVGRCWCGTGGRWIADRPDFR